MAYTSVIAAIILRLNAILKMFGNAEVKNEIANKGFHLPVELLLVILSRLSLKDNIRASSVCKAWHEAAVSVRSNSPWLVYLDIAPAGVSYGFYDPMEKKKTETMKLPDEPFYANLFYSKDGWLLLNVNYQEADPASLVFFNPFTQAHIILPSIETSDDYFAFSCAPTNESCVVCCIENLTPYRFLIHTWYFGAAEWVTEQFYEPLLSRFHGGNNIIFYGGCFWFPDEDGLGVFDPVARRWEFLQVPLPKLIPNHMWITEYKRNIVLAILVSNSGQMEVLLFELDWSRLVWEKKEAFDGLSIFVSGESSIVTNELTGDMSNIMCVWGSLYVPNRLSKFSLCTGSLCTDQHPSTKIHVMHYGAWIEQPGRHRYL